MCGRYDFQCGNGVCVKQEKVCDAVNDCLDFSDELQNCSMYMYFFELTFKTDVISNDFHQQSTHTKIVLNYLETIRQSELT